jgi:hypothetical protein
MATVQPLSLRGTVAERRQVWSAGKRLQTGISSLIGEKFLSPAATFGAGAHFLPCRDEKGATGNPGTASGVPLRTEIKIFANRNF